MPVVETDEDYSSSSSELDDVGNGDGQVIPLQFAPLTVTMQDEPVVVPPKSLYFKTEANSFQYPGALGLISFDPFDLSRSAAWTAADIALLKEEVHRHDQLLDVDWESVAGVIGGKKTPFQCASKYLNYVSVSQDPWTVDEERKLLALAEKYHQHYWNEIAAELGSNRSPVECLKHYQQALNANLLVAGDWTAEEDAVLSKAVQALGTSQWPRVASLLPGRTVDQCVDRWKHSSAVREDFTIGLWSEEDERHLFLAAVAFDLPLKAANVLTLDDTTSDGDVASSYNCVSWAAVAKLVPGK